ncbi:MAG: DUF1989 domain-containing protein [Actinobacteria bacterium]|nr:DUF1989 domain-containing protein [Actinomycetota bacterium]
MTERHTLDHTIPAGGFIGLPVNRGQTLRITDLEGKQVVDLVALNAADSGEKLSCVYSVMLNRTWLLTSDHILYSNFARPVFTITADTVGLHYSGGGFCTEEINRVRYNVEQSSNCAANLTEALRPFGIVRSDFDFDCCFNINMNLVYGPDGSMSLSEPLSKPGDYIDLRAEMDLVVGISNCPQDRNPCNAFSPTPILVQRLNE